MRLFNNVQHMNADITEARERGLSRTAVELRFVQMSFVSILLNMQHGKNADIKSKCKNVEKVEIPLIIEAYAKEVKDTRVSY